MKKNIHPYKTETLLVFSDGRTLKKRWVFFKKSFKTDFDFLKNILWQPKKIN